MKRSSFVRAFTAFLFLTLFTVPAYSQEHLGESIRKEIGKLFTDIGGTLKSITHHYSHFNWIFSTMAAKSFPVAKTSLAQ